MEQTVISEGIAWWPDLDARGLGVFAHPLGHKDTATTVRVGNGETLLTGGPFAETKEFVGGIAVVSCHGQDEAIEVAAAHPLRRPSQDRVAPIRERVTLSDVQAEVDAAFREEWGRVVATMVGRTGDWDLAEECAQEAFAEALRSWPAHGVPQRPGAWLTTVAGNRAIDRLRRAARGAERLERAGRDAPPPETEEETMPELFDETDEIADDRLRLMFTCCHPALPLEGRVALTLRASPG